MIKKCKHWLKNKIYSIQNLYGDFVYYPNRKKYISILKNYHNKYIGKSCFIIGNGSSLSAHDLEILKENNIITFASNKIYKIYNSTNWRPDFISVVDESHSRNKKFLKELDNAEAKVLFASSHFYNRFKNMHSNICYIKTRYSRKYLKVPRFSNDISKEIYSIATVTYFNMQIANYMGFDNIYLLGMDNNYAIEMKSDGTIVRNTNVKSYFGNQSDEEKKTIATTYEMDIAYGEAKKFTENHNLNIYNATRGGRLEKFKRKRFEQSINDIKKNG